MYENIRMNKIQRAALETPTLAGYRCAPPGLARMRVRVRMCMHAGLGAAALCASSARHAWMCMRSWAARPLPACLLHCCSRTDSGSPSLHVAPPLPLLAAWRTLTINPNNR